jgi:ABC-2 type transport system permease protein
MKIWHIAYRDFKTYFTSPIAYVVMGGFLIIIGWMFFGNLAYYNSMRMQMDAGRGGSITDVIIRPLYGNMNVILLFIVPFITMRLIAEERKMHTIELLMTSPVTITEIVLGKFLSGLLFISVMLALTIAYPAILFVFGSPDLGPILTCYMGTFFLVGSYLSIGIFFSSMTENQIVAAALGFSASLFLWLISWGSQFAGPVFGEVLDYLSIINHFNNFSRGLIDSSDVIFYVSFTGIGLFLTHRVLDSFRWR